MNKSIAGANDAVNNRKNSIGVDIGIVILFLSIMESQMKLFDALRYMRFCEQVSCQAVHGQPQDWKVCASRLVSE